MSQILNSAGCHGWGGGCHGWFRFSRDTPNPTEKGCIQQMHGKKSKVSRLSRVISKTIASVCVCAPAPEKRFLRSAVTAVTPPRENLKPAVRKPLRQKQGVTADLIPPVTPLPAAVTPRGGRDE